jgi:glycosyltransferase involved in cell wall biosynthesis
MGRDLVSRPYGRFYYLPRLMAERGHDICSLLLAYRKEPPVDFQEGGVRWISEPLQPNPFGYLSRLRILLEQVRPDWIIGLSDTYFGMLAQYFGRKYGIRSCIDAYDNYESYIPWLIPLHLCWRKALAGADLVTAAGPDLAAFLSRWRPDSPAIVVPMAADPIGFKPLDKTECRRLMGLPLDAQFVGYCGSLHKNRGVETLFAAIDILKETHPDVEFLVSGRKWKTVMIPASTRFLGYIDDEKMPLLLNCIDTLSVINRPTAFGRYSYPVKLYEAMNCQVPIVATRTPATEWILRGHPEFLVPPSDPLALSQKIGFCLRQGRLRYANVTTWESSCDAFERGLLRVNQAHEGE